MQCLAKGSNRGDREEEMSESVTKKADPTGFEDYPVRWHRG